MRWLLVSLVLFPLSLVAESVSILSPVERAELKRNRRSPNLEQTGGSNSDAYFHFGVQTFVKALEKANNEALKEGKELVSKRTLLLLGANAIFPMRTLLVDPQNQVKGAYLHPDGKKTKIATEEDADCDCLTNLRNKKKPNRTVIDQDISNKGAHKTLLIQLDANYWDDVLEAELIAKHILLMGDEFMNMLVFQGDLPEDLALQERVLNHPNLEHVIETSLRSNERLPERRPPRPTPPFVSQPIEVQPTPEHLLNYSGKTPNVSPYAPTRVTRPIRRSYLTPSQRSAMVERGRRNSITRTQATPPLVQPTYAPVAHDGIPPGETRASWSLKQTRRAIFERRMARGDAKRAAMQRDQAEKMRDHRAYMNQLDQDIARRNASLANIKTWVAPPPKPSIYDKAAHGKGHHVSYPWAAANRLGGLTKQERERIMKTDWWKRRQNR